VADKFRITGHTAEGLFSRLGSAHFGPEQRVVTPALRGIDVEVIAVRQVETSHGDADGSFDVAAVEIVAVAGKAASGLDRISAEREDRLVRARPRRIRPFEYQ
jgi:hypothetical protein